LNGAAHRYAISHERVRNSLVLGLLLPFGLSATAARISFLNTVSLIFSPSWMLMARLTFFSRLELNIPIADRLLSALHVVAAPLHSRNSASTPGSDSRIQLSTRFDLVR
jgi:hypothetical protein